MTQKFLAAVIDTILPGDLGEAGCAVPSGSQAGVRVDIEPPAAAMALQLIIEQGGGAETFIRADEDQRIAVLEAVEHGHAAEFRSLVMALLQDYYESDAVLIALGASVEPPQPGGRPLTPAQPATLALLDKVRRRGAL